MLYRRGGRPLGFVGLTGSSLLPPRRQTGIAELDRVCGGGLVPVTLALVAEKSITTPGTYNPTNPLHLAAGRSLFIHGPSGCGKSTLLRMVAGLEDITEGAVHIGERVVNDLEPAERDIAMVFQNYALYPHMTVGENIGFGLRMRKASEAEIRRQVDRAASLMQISSLLDRYAGELSGAGAAQRQRGESRGAVGHRFGASLAEQPPIERRQRPMHGAGWADRGGHGIEPLDQRAHRQFRSDAPGLSSRYAIRHRSQYSVARAFQCGAKMDATKVLVVGPRSGQRGKAHRDHEFPFAAHRQIQPLTRTGTSPARVRIIPFLVPSSLRRALSWHLSR